MGRTKKAGRPKGAKGKAKGTKGKAKGTKKRVAKAAVPKGPDYSKFVHLGPINICEMEAIRDNLMDACEFLNKCIKLYGERNKEADDGEDDSD